MQSVFQLTSKAHHPFDQRIWYVFRFSGFFFFVLCATGHFGMDKFGILLLKFQLAPLFLHFIRGHWYTYLTNYWLKDNSFGHTKTNT